VLFVELVGTEVIVALAADVEDAVAVEVELFPVELFDALAVEDEELLAVDVVEPVEGA
jgi:hypothetical protein